MMKKFAVLAAAAAFVFGVTSCSQVDDDENLLLTISQNGTVVSIDYPDDYDGMEVTVVYGITEPVIDYTTTPPTYTGSYKYTEPFIPAFDGAGGDSVVIYARAFYYNNETLKYTQGPLAQKRYTKPAVSAPVTNAPDASGKVSGDFVFTLAETGNSNTTHYFDTSSSNCFKLNDTFNNVYYQTQFSWKGNGKGNWYLYMRDKNNGLIKGTDGNTSFVAKGTYTGDCFNSTSGSVAGGNLLLKNAAGNDAGTVVVDTKAKPQFTMNVTGSGITLGGSSGDAQLSSGNVSVHGMAK